MRKLITICAVLCLMLISTSVSWASLVSTPLGAPSWWNSETGLYAYGWWSSDIISGGPIVSPTNDSIHWASSPGYISNTDFTASIGIGTSDGTVTLDLGNVFHEELYKQIYVYITGTTVSNSGNFDAVRDTDGGIFYGDFGGTINQNGTWDYMLSGEIHPQPSFVHMTLTVPGMTSVTNIWAGERCIPEPATICLLGLGAFSLIRRKRIA